MKDESVQTPGAREKLDSYEAVMRGDKAAQFRAVVYAKLLRAMTDEFGEDVLDIAENVRREHGRYNGEMSADYAEAERKYREDPAILIREMDEYWHGNPVIWSRTCICDFIPNPDERRHELRSVKCTYGEAFRSVKEERIGITWCCQDMGYTPTFHPLFAQYMPMHLLKGDGCCYQIRKLAETPEEQERLNSIEHTGWRSFR